MPVSKKQIAKTETHLLIALEDHLSTLASLVLDLQKGDAAYIKDIATKLRLLICGSTGQQGLLWDLLKIVGGSDLIRIRRSGKKIDPNEPISRGMRIFDIYAAVNSMASHFPLQEVSLREHITNDEVAYIDGASLTSWDVIKQLAENSGTAHETPGVTREMAIANAHRINDVQPFIPLINRVSLWTLDVGEDILRFAIANKGHIRRRNITRPPDVDLTKIKFHFPMEGPKLENTGSGNTLLVTFDIAHFIDAMEQRKAIYLGSQTVGKVVVSFEATRRGRLRLTSTGLAIPYFTYEGSASRNSDGMVIVCMTWQGMHICVYVNGKLVQGIPQE